MNKPEGQFEGMKYGMYKGSGGSKDLSLKHLKGKRKRRSKSRRTK